MNEDLRNMTQEALELLLKRRLDEVYIVRREIDRRRGIAKPSVEIDFEGKYITN